jgi:hypothetical protein
MKSMTLLIAFRWLMMLIIALGQNIEKESQKQESQWHCSLPLDGRYYAYRP